MKLKDCPRCGTKWLLGATSHNCGTVTISKDEYAALKAGPAMSTGTPLSGRRAAP